MCVHAHERNVRGSAVPVLRLLLLEWPRCAHVVALYLLPGDWLWVPAKSAGVMSLWDTLSPKPALCERSHIPSLSSNLMLWKTRKKSLTRDKLLQQHATHLLLKPCTDLFFPICFVTSWAPSHPWLQTLVGIFAGYKYSNMLVTFLRWHKAFSNKNCVMLFLPINQSNFPDL